MATTAVASKTANDSTPTVLFIAAHAEERYGLNSLLVAQKYEVYCRDSRMRAFQLMTVYQIDLVIVDLELADGSGMEFCRDFRTDANFHNIPVVVTGPDNELGQACVEALGHGADDFVQTPFVPAVCLARIQRLVTRRMKSKNQVKSSLSVQVSSGELPGLIQYLEAEVKTGRLNVKSSRGLATIYIKDGKFVHATAPQYEGVAAVTEALSWEHSHVTFEDAPLQPHEIKQEQKLTSVLMNCVVDVDEFREAKRSLPPPDAMYLPGPKPPPGEMPRQQRDLWEQAINGNSVDELLRDQTFGERQATLWFKELLDDGFLRLTDPPFHSYTLNTFRHYQRLHYRQKLLSLRQILADVTFPLERQQGTLPLAPANWISPAAKIVVTGDRADHAQLFVDSVVNLCRHTTGQSPPVQRAVPGAPTVRCDFGDKNVLDIQKLPPVMEKRFIQTLDEFFSEVVAVVLIVTDQTRRANQMNLRLIRQIRQRFKGVFYNVVPKVGDKDGRHLFKIDCANCGYRLAVDADEAGTQGECPICNADIMIPDPLDYLALSLQLPNDVPIVLVEPDNPLHIRDLLLLIIDTVVYATNPPESALAQAQAKVQTHIVASEAPGTPAVAATPRPAAKPAAVASVPPTEVPPDPPDPAADSDPVEELSSILQLSLSDLSQAAKPAPEPTPSLNLEEILQSQDDDFDIDDFIKKVQR